VDQVRREALGEERVMGTAVASWHRVRMSLQWTARPQGCEQLP
jgi:hypothetical protein